MKFYWDDFIDKIMEGRIMYAGEPADISSLTMRQILEMFYV